MDKADALGQIDAALTVAERAAEREFSADTAEQSNALTVSVSTISRLAPIGSAYEDQAKRVVASVKTTTLVYGVRQIVGVLTALRHDIEADYLRTVEEETRAGVFADFLEMGEHLLKEKHPLPAAVVAGAALEAHIRALADKSRVTTTSGGKPKRAGRLNDDLAKARIYSKAEQKQILAWQDIRNDAAHGDENFDANQVGLMIQGIRDFIARNPA